MWSESPVRRPYPRVRQMGEAAVAAPGRHWPMDDAGPNLAEASGGAPFAPVRMYGTAEPTYQVSPLAPGSTHAVTFPPGIMLQVEGFDVPTTSGWVTWDFWVSVSPDDGFATLAQIGADGPGGTSSMNAEFSPYELTFSMGAGALVDQTFDPPANPVHLRWSVRTSGGAAAESVMDINDGADGSHYTLPGNTWHWASGSTCSFYSSSPMTVDEVRIYAGLPA
jgi:hypothetical protein